MRQKIILLISLFLISLVIGCNGEVGNVAASTAPDFETTDINGAPFKLSDNAGKVIILNFFATWCPPCKAEMPDFNDIAEEYKNEVRIVAINVGNEGLSSVKSFVEKNGLTFTVAMDDGRISDLYGPISAIPVSVIIDKNFKISKRYIGMRPKEIFISDIKSLL